MKKILCSALQYCSGAAVNISNNSAIKNLNRNIAEVNRHSSTYHNLIAAQSESGTQKRLQIIFFCEYLRSLFYR